MGLEHLTRADDSHSVCKKCLQQFWRAKESQECPVCGRTSSKNPSCNLVLKNLRREAQKHTSEMFRLNLEDVPSNEGKLKIAWHSLKGKLQHGEKLKREFEKTFQLIKCQAEYTEHQIKHQFKKLHQFLRDEEAARITALREEEEQKKQTMKEKLEEMNRHMSALSHTIKDLEEMMKAKDVQLLKKFPVMMERVQISQLDAQMPSGALIHVSRYLGNLSYRVWKKMLNSVQKTPVILDPNTAHSHLVLSDDLTRVKFVWDEQPLPDNPERFDICECVLGSKGFTSGTHSWEVQVKESECWSLGVTTESNQRKGRDFCDTDAWCVTYDLYSQLRSGFLIEEELEYVRVDLDYDGGTVSFSDPVTNTHLHTFITSFTEKIFPFFCNLDELKALRILPFKL
ncbi:E3 ubiquitin-protein ligase TRIM35-like [Garra rufa]|uniref:E3 ubiquitin-protein ligase TRIM35-like n=1 Tax=Garra rufa TaxID=137080 RepID=UPI003CCE5838